MDDDDGDVKDQSVDLSQNLILDISLRAAARSKILKDIKLQANTQLIEDQFIFSLPSALCLFSTGMKTNVERIAGIAETYHLAINLTNEDDDSFFTALAESIDQLSDKSDESKSSY